MNVRNLCPQTMFERLALEHEPLCRFDEKRKDFMSWKKNTLPKVMTTLGDFPAKVKLNPQLLAEWDEDGLRKQRWIIDVGRHISAVFQINFTADMAPGEKRAAILCWHGHGQFGKQVVMGDASSPEKSENIKRLNYNYGHQMAKSGFITYAIDWIGAGERHPGHKPNHRSSEWEDKKDWCNLLYLHATMLGMTSISINVVHGMAATDFACTFPFVDRNKLGVMGLSGGGTMTTWTALCDKRMRAAEIICYSDLWACFIRDNNICGMQVAPALFKLVDLPELQGLIAPKPLLIDIGIYDTCFLIDGAMQCFRRLEKIYKAAGASARLELDLFPGGHAWGGNKSVEFFRRHLADKSNHYGYRGLVPA